MAALTSVFDVAARMVGVVAVVVLAMVGRGVFEVDWAWIREDGLKKG